MLPWHDIKYWNIKEIYGIVIWIILYLPKINKETFSRLIHNCFFALNRCTKIHIIENKPILSC